MIALVVILGNNFPVRLNFVGKAQTHLEFTQWITLNPLGYVTQLRQQSVLWVFSQPKPTTPTLNRQCGEFEICWIDFFGMRCMH